MRHEKNIKIHAKEKLEIRSRDKHALHKQSKAHTWWVCIIVN
jgi:hypothetical protein